MRSTAHRRHPATAVYLRCYPFDRQAMASHRGALEEYAVSLGLPIPVVHLDNGVSSRMNKPLLESLLARAADGFFQTVLVPGLWVFALDDARAAAVADGFRQVGARVVELPGRRYRRAGHPPRSGTDRPTHGSFTRLSIPSPHRPPCTNSL
ncbi:recombinase family protein [Embleya sp. NBC_00896]|uniref:recombinase family protein n=1 Tax=Embleya sp. NBC_00896 TaxID=2975961 RepID=UPI002F91B186|nr:recombinase family protein [Embleya sp. NBC_00896]